MFTGILMLDIVILVFIGLVGGLIGGFIMVGLFGEY